MKLLSNGFIAVLSMTLVVSLTGCSQPAGDQSSAHVQHEHDHAHAHPDEGPHHGHLIELGNEEFHAELVHDDATHLVTVYLLDGTAMKVLPIATKSVTINLLQNGAPMQFELPAAPQPDDPSDQSSRFELASEALCDGFDAPGARTRLNVAIGGKPYAGTIAPHVH